MLTELDPLHIDTVDLVPYSGELGTDDLDLVLHTFDGPQSGLLQSRTSDYPESAMPGDLGADDSLFGYLSTI